MHDGEHQNDQVGWCMTHITCHIHTCIHHSIPHRNTHSEPLIIPSQHPLSTHLVHMPLYLMSTITTTHPRGPKLSRDSSHKPSYHGLRRSIIDCFGIVNYWLFIRTRDKSQEKTTTRQFVLLISLVFSRSSSNISISCHCIMSYQYSPNIPYHCLL